MENNVNNDLINAAAGINVGNSASNPNLTAGPIVGAFGNNGGLYSKPDASVSQATNEGDMEPKSTQPTPGNPIPVKEMKAPVQKITLEIEKGEADEFKLFQAQRKAAKEAQTANDAKPKEDPKVTRHNNLVKQYGEGYIVATKEGTNQQQIFTRQSWEILGANANIEKWRQVVKTPPEVAAMQGNQFTGIPGTNI